MMRAREGSRLPPCPKDRHAASPLPWSVVEKASCFVVEDASGQGLGWLYFRDEPLVARQARVLLKDEARRMAVNFARLPELLRKEAAARSPQHE
jgi:hypothetical protein